MRKPLVSRMPWMASVTVQMLMAMAVVLGPLLTPVSHASVINGTAGSATNFTSSSSAPTTISPFLPDISETTLNPQFSNQVDELTTTEKDNLSSSTSVNTSTLLSKRHSSILPVSSTFKDVLPKFFSKSTSSSSTSTSVESASFGDDVKSQKNGIGTTAEEELSSSSTAEQNDDNALPTTTDKESGVNDSASGGGSTSMSIDKDESDTYFSDPDTPPEGDSSGSGSDDGDTIFPPEDGLDTQESVGATTYESLLRPAPTINPQSFSSQQQPYKNNKSSGGSAARTLVNRIGTRGLSSKSELNAITTAVPNTTPASVISSSSNIDSENVDSNNSGSDVIVKDSHINISNETSTADSSVDLSGSKFQSRSNALGGSSAEPQQQSLRARPTSSVINSGNSSSSISSRIIKRKKIPNPGRGQFNHSGSSLSSIYNNSLLTSSPGSSNSSESNSAMENVEVTTILPVVLPLASTDSILSAAEVLVGDSTTESNSLLNTSHQDRSSSNITESKRESSPASTSGSGSSSSLTTPEAPADEISSTTGNTTTSNNGTTVSASRAILGFGQGSSHGKVKRPKPIIIRDHEDSLYINNISEPAGTTENTGVSQAGLGDGEETATSFNAGAGEEASEGSNKPLGNALPTPPFKTRRVKLTSRRVSSRPSINAAPVTPLPVVTIKTTEPAIYNITNLMAEAASGASSYMHMHGIVRPSAITPHHGGPRYENHPLYSSRRVYKEEFGVSSSSYGFDRTRGDDDHDEGGEDGELQATTEFFMPERPTHYPMGIRSQPEYPIESEDNEEPKKKHGKAEVGNDSGGSDRYRDYYSDAHSPSVTEHGSGNLHIKSANSHDVSSTASPVTVTVTQTVVETTPQITPTATIGDSEPANRNLVKGNDNEEHGEGVGVENGADAKGSHPNLLPTPALPSSIFVSSTAIKSFETGQGLPEISQSVEDIQVSSTRYGITSAGIQTTHFGDHHDDDDNHGGNDHQGGMQMQNQKRGHNEEEEQHLTTPMMPQHDDIHPTPVISSKEIKSVYFTQVEHPHFSSSSYEFTTSSMYSYFYPDNDGMHHSGEVSHDEDDHVHVPSPLDRNRVRPSPTHTEHSPAEEEDIEHHHYNSTTSVMTTISDGKRVTATSPTTQFWDELAGGVNLTKSSSSQVPITMDQETGGVPTPAIDVDVYPPPGIGPNSKVEEAGTTTPVIPVPTGRPSTTKGNASAIPGNVEDNEISEEELRKQQLDAATIGKTTTKPESSDADGVTPNKGKGDEELSTVGNDNNVPPAGGGVNKNNSDSKTTPDIKTPFGVGESFGIGSVHVPILVKMDLDVAQPVFCSHLNNFKEMIVTVYGSEKNLQVDPEQIVLFTEPGCNDSKSSNGSKSASSGSFGATSTTRKPGTPTEKLLTTLKGTYPLTSPPQPITGGDDEGSRKSRSGKEFTTKNATSSALVNNKSLSESNKSTSVVNTEEASAQPNKSSSVLTSLIRSRRSTKMATAAAATKNTNFSEDTVKPVNNNSSLLASGLDLSVYFYLNDKNGSYDEDLTSSFVKLWNDSSRLTNNTNNNSSGGNDGSNSGSNSSNEMFIKRVKNVGMITASHLVSTQDTPDENSGIIVAITVASIVAVCLFVLGVGLLVMRHRQSQTKFAKRCTPVTLDDYSLDNISVYNSFRRKQRLRGSKRSYTNAAFDDPNAPSRPLSASALGTTLTDIAALENEFRAIPNISPTLDDIPHGAETKNRYANVIPMPDTRVLLTFQEDTPNSDYMNANYVRGVNGESKRYIVTQGPLEDTIVDFWRMVWEQQIRVVFMLTDFAEGGIAKCAEYYPRSETIDCSQLHGDYQITLEKRDVADNCITSYLVLKDMERNLRRDVVHFWYHSWPEKGVPASPKMTIDFLNRSRKFTKESTPVLVHCSPGTGRSGTIVACDVAMKEYDTQNKVDIPRVVMKIRQDRAGAVQTKEQYIHIYEVLHSHASRIGATSLESI